MYYVYNNNGGQWPLPLWWPVALGGQQQTNRNKQKKNKNKQLLRPPCVVVDCRCPAAASGPKKKPEPELYGLYMYCIGAEVYSNVAIDLLMIMKLCIYELEL
jgi:hypothetical protein